MQFILQKIVRCGIIKERFGDVIMKWSTIKEF